MNIQGERRGDRLIWNLQDTRDNEIADLMTHVSYMNKDKIVDLQKRYVELYKELGLITKKYEEEIMKSVAMEEQIKELTKKLANMQSTSHGHTAEMVDVATNVPEEFVPISTKVAFPNQIKIQLEEYAGRIEMLEETGNEKGMFSLLEVLQHRIDILKGQIKDVLKFQISLKEAGDVCFSTISFLESLFNVCSGRNRLMDKLEVSIVYRDDLSKKITDTKEIVGTVNSLFSFFKGKYQLIKGKLQKFVDGYSVFVPVIYDKERNFKQLDVWKYELEMIVENIETLLNLGNDIDIPGFN